MLVLDGVQLPLISSLLYCGIAREYQPNWNRNSPGTSPVFCVLTFLPWVDNYDKYSTVNAELYEGWNRVALEKWPSLSQQCCESLSDDLISGPDWTGRTANVRKDEGKAEKISFYFASFPLSLFPGKALKLFSSDFIMLVLILLSS